MSKCADSQKNGHFNSHDVWWFLLSVYAHGFRQICKVLPLRFDTFGATKFFFFAYCSSNNTTEDESKKFQTKKYKLWTKIWFSPKTELSFLKFLFIWFNKCKICCTPTAHNSIRIKPMKHFILKWSFEMKRTTILDNWVQFFKKNQIFVIIFHTILNDYHICEITMKCQKFYNVDPHHITSCMMSIHVYVVLLYKRFVKTPFS